MATYLYRLGGWAFTHRRKVLIGWLAAFIVDRTERAVARRGLGPYVKSHLATIERWQEIDYAVALA